MPSGFCPVCDVRVGISTTDLPIGNGGTACWWVVDVHVDKRATECDCGHMHPCPHHGRPICRGTSRRI